MPVGELFGLVAGGVVTCSFIPQLVRVFKLKSAREISTLFTSLLLAGVFLWLAYGLYFHLRPVILWNAISIALVGTLLGAKLKYGR